MVSSINVVLFLNLFLFPLCPCVDLPIIPEVGLAFAISANAAQSETNFQKMKAVIDEIIEMFGQERIHYSLIVFGSVPDVKIEFNDNLPTDELLKTLKSVERASGSALAATLQKAQEIFNKYSRSGVRKVLVVITDTKSDSDENELREKASLLEQAQIKVIPVGLGSETDGTELKTLTPRKKDVITKPDTSPSKILVKVIMTKVIEGNFGCIYFRLCCLTYFVGNDICQISLCVKHKMNSNIFVSRLADYMSVSQSVCLSICLLLSVALSVGSCLSVSLYIYLSVLVCQSAYL